MAQVRAAGERHSGFIRERDSAHTAVVAETLKAPGQPFTFGGVARYASARFGRLLGMALLFAILPAAVICRIAAHCWWPVITEAIEALPESARIEGGTLRVQETEARLLA